jgi:hypothetical protein
MRSIMPSLVCHVNACPCLSSFSLASVALAAQSPSSRGAQARPPCAGSQTSSRRCQAFKHPCLDAKLSLVAAVEPRCRLVAPLSMGHWHLSCSPDVVASLALASSADRLFAGVTRFKDADPRASALRALHQKSGCRTEKRPQASCHASVACSSSEKRTLHLPGPAIIVTSLVTYTPG